MPWPKISKHPVVQARYEQIRDQGESHSLAEMFALQQPPMSNTDREFMEGRCNGNQFEKCPQAGDAYQAVADQAGVDTTGKFYMSGLASFPGDPRAWVSGRGDVQAVCEERGWDCDGSVRVRANRRDQPPVEVGLAESLIREEVDAIEAAAPEPINREEVREAVIQQRTPHWSA